MIRFFTLLTALIFVTVALKSQTKNDTIKNHITKTPVIIDGKADEECWADTEWNAIDQVWMPFDATMKDGDFEGKFKVAWDELYLYLLVEVVDDSLSDDHSDPLSNWWDDDCLEIFIDENRSMGNHEFNNNAFAYHVSLSYDAIDLSPSKQGINYKEHVTVKMDTIAENTYLWEMAFKIYDDTYDNDNPEASRVSLTPEKLMGITVAYCDNDETTSRENFIGSMQMTASTNNEMYKNADYFGPMKLVDPDYVKPIDLKLESPINICIGDSTGIDAGLGYITYEWSNNVSDTNSIEVSEPGIYTVTVTDASGVSSVGTVEVIVIDLPIVNLGSDISQNGSIELDAGSGFESYYWSTDSKTQTITVNESGEYWVQVSNNYNCFGADTINVTITNISDNLSTYLNIYPNPAKTQININTSANSGEITTYTISSITGQILRIGSFHDRMNKVNIENLKAGMYLLNVKSEGYDYSRTFIKE